MIKKNHLERRDYFWLIIFLIIIVPINISFNGLDDFRFDVINYPSPSGSFLFTLPISFFFVIPFIILGIFNFYKDFEILLFLIIVFSSLFTIYIEWNSSSIILISKIVLPILILLGFQIFLKEKLLLIKKKNKFNFFEKYNEKITLIFLIVFFISIVSPFYLDSNYDWLINGITIFDYHQYFPLIFILLLGILADNKQKFFFLIVYIFSFHLSKKTSNMTFFVILCIFGIYYILSLFFLLNRKYLITWSKICIATICLIFFTYPFLFFVFESELIKLNFPDSLFGTRLIMMNNYFDKINFLNFLTPIRFSSDILSIYYHNELIVILSAIGFLGAFLFYFIIIKRLWLISKYFPHLAMSLTLFGVCSSIVITVSLHPYTFIILTFFTSYYYVISKYKLK